MFCGGRHRGKEPPISRAELHHFENSLVAAMERMFDERLPISNSGARHQRVKNLHDGHFDHRGQHGKGAQGHISRPHVLIGAEDYCVFSKRKIQQETSRRSHDQQHPCEKECHQPKLRASVKNEKKRYSTIREKEFHQPKLSVRVKKKELRDPTICEERHKKLYEKDTQKLSQVEDRSFEKTFLSNMTISSSFSFDVKQVHKENEVVNYDQHPIFDEEDQVMLMNKDAEISLYLQHKDQIEGNNNANAFYSTDASSVAFEEDLIMGSFATTAAPLPSQNMAKYDTYAYVASQDVEVIVHQELCENEGHISKLRESETKSELCDSTQYDFESVQIMKM
jgi:hypothetical protein